MQGKGLLSRKGDSGQASRRKRAPEQGRRPCSGALFFAGGARLALVDELAAEDGGVHHGGEQLVGGDGEDVLAEDGQVAVVAGLDAALHALFKAGVGAAGGVAVHGLVDVHALVGVEAALRLFVQVFAGHGAVEVVHGVQILHRAVGAKGGVDAQLVHGVEGVAGRDQLLPDPALQHRHVVVQEDGLDVGEDVVFAEALDQGGVGDLAVDHPVAVGVFAVADGVVAVEHLLDGRVADGVHRHLAAVLVGQFDHGVGLLLGQGLDPLGGGVVGVGLSHGGGAGAQRAVHKQLQGADLVVAVAGAGLVSLVQKGLVAGGVHEVALVVDPQGGVAGLDVFIRLQGLAPAPGADVHGLHRGDAPLGGVGHGGAQGVLDLLHGGLVLQGHHHVGRGLAEDAGGLAVFVHVEVGPLGLGGVLGDAGHLDGQGVGADRVAAGPLQHQGVLGGDFVQVVAVHHPGLVGEVVLVPARAVEEGPRRRLGAGDEVAGDLFDLGHGGAAVHVDGLQVLPHEVEVHVAVVEAGHHSAALGVVLPGAGGGGGPALLVGANGLDDPVFDADGLGESLPLQVDLSVDDDAAVHVTLPPCCRWLGPRLPPAGRPARPRGSF